MTKKISLTIVLFLVMTTITAQDRIIHQSQLPLEIQNYVKKHFPNEKILTVEEDKDYFSTSYEIQLQNNIELEFKGVSIKEISSKSKLPNSVIPLKIRNYISEKYPNSYITDWELDDYERRQQVELNNGLELEFNKNGKFIKLDD